MLPCCLFSLTSETRRVLLQAAFGFGHGSKRQRQNGETVKPVVCDRPSQSTGNVLSRGAYQLVADLGVSIVYSFVKNKMPMEERISDLW